MEIHTQRRIKEVNKDNNLEEKTHKQGEQNKQCVLICNNCGVRSGAKPHAEGAPIRRRSWQTQYTGRRCPRPLSWSLSPSSHCLDFSLPPIFLCLRDKQTRDERQYVNCSAVRTTTGVS